MSDGYYVLILHPEAAAFLAAPLPPRDQWKYEHWAQRFERHYGVPPEKHEGAEGTLYGVRIV